jgi:hypothetical protein
MAVKRDAANAPHQRVWQFRRQLFPTHVREWPDGSVLAVAAVRRLVGHRCFGKLAADTGSRSGRSAACRGRTRQAGKKHQPDSEVRRLTA